MLAASGARELTASQKDRAILEIVAMLAERAGIPMPRVYEIKEAQPNAMAVGPNPQHAALILTTGLRKLMPQDEMTALIGHELAHIKSRDTLAATIGATFLDAILSLSLVLAFIGVAARRHGGGAIIALAIFAPVTGLILHLAASRSREYAADRYGAELTGGPQAMIAALHLLQPCQAHHNDVALRIPATTSLWFVDPLAGTWLSRLLSSHPSIERRIARLERLHHSHF